MSNPRTPEILAIPRRVSTLSRLPRYFATGEDRPLLTDTKLIDRLYKRNRIFVMTAITLGYGIAHMCRRLPRPSHLSSCKAVARPAPGCHAVGSIPAQGGSFHRSHDGEAAARCALRSTGPQVSTYFASAFIIPSQVSTLPWSSMSSVNHVWVTFLLSV